MIIGEALGRLFYDLTINYKERDYSTKYHYGDQVELVKWMSVHQGQIKYPVIWYVIGGYTEHDKEYNTSARLILLTNTEITVLNSEKANREYFILNEVYNKVTALLLRNPFISIFGKTNEKFDVMDFPSDSTTNGFLGIKKESISTDPVCSRVINFDMSIRCSCVRRA